MSIGESLPSLAVPDCIYLKDFMPPDPRRLQYFDGDLAESIKSHAKAAGHFIHTRQTFLDTHDIPDFDGHQDYVIGVENSTGFEFGTPFQSRVVSRISEIGNRCADFRLFACDKDATTMLFDNIVLGRSTLLTREDDHLSDEVKEATRYLNPFAGRSSTAISMLSSFMLAQKLINAKQVSVEELAVVVDTTLDDKCFDIAEVISAEVFFSNKLGTFALRHSDIKVARGKNVIFYNRHVRVSGIRHRSEAPTEFFYEAEVTEDNELNEKRQTRKVLFDEQVALKETDDEDNQRTMSEEGIEDITNGRLKILQNGLSSIV